MDEDLKTMVENKNTAEILANICQELRNFNDYLRNNAIDVRTEKGRDW